MHTLYWDAKRSYSSNSEAKEEQAARTDLPAELMLAEPRLSAEAFYHKLQGRGLWGWLEKGFYRQNIEEARLAATGAESTS